jgi:hypothetical protein
MQKLTSDVTGQKQYVTGKNVIPLRLLKEVTAVHYKNHTYHIL